ncbi:hypothetical protein BC831DRAFT_449437 [Entophlyctis helioformis]|nr:hypothetical protein BC831DRAFT_449437 [Entophlyctis helioformis]
MTPQISRAVAQDAPRMLLAMAYLVAAAPLLAHAQIPGVDDTEFPDRPLASQLQSTAAQAAPTASDTAVKSSFDRPDEQRDGLQILFSDWKWTLLGLGIVGVCVCITAVGVVFIRRRFGRSNAPLVSNGSDRFDSRDSKHEQPVDAQWEAGVAKMAERTKFGLAAHRAARKKRAAGKGDAEEEASALHVAAMASAGPPPPVVVVTVRSP